MTEEEKGTIEHANIIIKEGLDREDDIQGILKKLLNLIQKQQKELHEKEEKYQDLLMILASKAGKNFNKEMQNKKKSEEDLELLNEGWKIEPEKKDKIMDEMANNILKER